MFTIQYEAVNGECKLADVKTRSRTYITARLAGSEHPIVAVYEQGTPVTKAMRKLLAEWPGTLSRAARDFISSRP